ALPEPRSPGGVAFTRDGDAYALTTRAGLVLSGRVGGGPVFSRVALNGTELGSYTAMVNYQDGGLRWQDITKVTDVAFSEKKGWGVLKVSGEYRGNGGRRGFAIEQSVAVHPDRPYFIANLSRVVNTGSEPLDVKALYLRQYAPYARDKAADRRKDVPNLWKAPKRDVWVRAADGAWWGGMTKSADCVMFRYFLTPDGGQHPDAMFGLAGDAPAGSPDGFWRLGPGAAYDPHGMVWALCIGGAGGRDGWERQLGELGE
ncbi:MAG: hypothetical protein IKE55_11580, partial [Kiritimatiellae bacterium]|nr:hypothetical protein [Kiritimatiellia bacterium]